MRRSDFTFIAIAFLIWRIGITVIALFAIKYVPLFSHNFLGGGYSTYITQPLFWGHMNFDGEHYLSLVQNGYRPLEYFFFPLFPMLISFISYARNLLSIAWSGLIVNNILFFVALIGIYKLVKLDFNIRLAKLTVVILLFFPTSFFFGTYYTESLFLTLIVWSFYESRRGNFLLASILAALSSATRIIGVVMLPILVLEYIHHKKKLKDLNKWSFLPILISPSGLGLYMIYLLQKTGDPLIFLHQVSIFGEQRSSTFVLLPQVLYRYLFKILPVINNTSFPNIFTTYLEFIVATVFIALIIYSFFKLKMTYSLFSFFSFIIPTLAGSFSSMPRYALVIFPIFILMATIISKFKRPYQYLFFSVMLILMVIAESLFWRGYWLS